MIHAVVKMSSYLLSWRCGNLTEHQSWCIVSFVAKIETLEVRLSLIFSTWLASNVFVSFCVVGRVQSQPGMVARYRPLLANVNSSKKRFSDTSCDTRLNSVPLKGKIFSRQVSQRGTDQPSQNLSVAKKSGSSSVHTSEFFLIRI